MGVMHASMIEAAPGAEVAALVDPTESARLQTASMLGRAVPHFATVEAALAACKFDGAVVSTPQFAHRAPAEALLAAGVGVLVEKPLSNTLADARAMAEAARRHPGVPAAVGFMLGHNPLFREAARLVAAGALGRVVSARGTCFLSQVFAPCSGWTFNRERAGGGVVINSGSHLLYALQLIMGPVAGVVARGGGVHNEVEDTVAALLDFESGAFGSINISWSMPGHEFQTHDILIEGSNGFLELSNEALRLWLIKPAASRPAGWTETRRDLAEPRAAFSMSPDYCGDEFYLENLDFIEALARRRAPLVTWEDGLRVQELLEALYRSMRERRHVDLASVRGEGAASAS